MDNTLEDRLTCLNGKILNALQTGEVILLHPTVKSMRFAEILAGKYCYTQGQGVYNAVRSTEIITRQIEIMILQGVLDSVNYRDIRKDWLDHITSINRVYNDEQYPDLAIAMEVAKSSFNTWRTILQNSMLDFIREMSSCFSVGVMGNKAGFHKYIDWLVCLGIIPLIRNERKLKHPKHKHCQKLSIDKKLHVSKSLSAKGFDIVNHIQDKFDGVTIMDYDSSAILYDMGKNEFRSYSLLSGKPGETVVFKKPSFINGEILFDSPLERLYTVILRTYSMRNHAKVCQLLNTIPVKVLIGKQHQEITSEKLTKMVDGDDDKTNASSSSKLINLILKMKNMDSIKSVTDIVNEYLDDTSEKIIDVNRIDASKIGFGNAIKVGDNGMTTKEAFQNTFTAHTNKILTDHINKQFINIQKMKERNMELEYKIEQLNKTVNLANMKLFDAEESKFNITESNFETMPVVDGLRKVEPLDFEIIDVSKQMDDSSTVYNSFLSRYIPPYREEESELFQIWEQEIIRSFKMIRMTNNQGQEMALMYSNSSIDMIMEPYFSKILETDKIGYLIANRDAYESTEELFKSVFKRSRLATYLSDIFERYLARIKSKYERSNSRDDQYSNSKIHPRVLPYEKKEKRDDLIFRGGNEWGHGGQRWQGFPKENVF